MAFATPLMIGVGLAAIAVPILLHLIMQQKPKRMIFPALRFVQEKIATNQRRLRVRHWLLLLLRCLGLFLAALAFAKPSVATNLFGSWITLGMLSLIALLLLFVLISILMVSRPVNRLYFGITAAIFAGVVASAVSVYNQSLGTSPALLAGNDQSPVAAVVIIDNAPRMAYEFARPSDDDAEELPETESRLSESQKLADWLVRELPDESRVAVMDATDEEPFFSIDIAAASKRITSIGIQADAQSLPSRILSAIDFLENDEQTTELPKEIYVMTDMTLKSWQSKLANQLKLRLDDNRSISVYIVDVGVENATNYQLDDLELSSESMSLGGQIRIVARAARQGPPGERPLQLVVDKIDPRRPQRRDGQTLYPAEQELHRAALTFAENGVATSTMTVKDLPVGVHHGVVRLQGADGLKIDNEKYFTVEVKEPSPILLIRPDNTNETVNPVVSDLISVVLAPDELVQTGQAQFSTETINQNDMLDIRLKPFDAVFLLDPKPMSDAQWQALNRFARSGGGVAIILGENAKGTFGPAPEFESDEAIKSLAGILGEVWTSPSESLASPDYSHPIFTPFKKFETDDVWRDFSVYQHWGLAESTFEPDKVSTLARLSNGQPLIAERQIGEGRILTVTTPFTEPGQVTGRGRWNDLTTGNWWPGALLINRMATYLVAAKNTRLNYEVGDNVVIRLPDDSDVETFLLFSPRNEEPSELPVFEQEIRYRFTETPGNYRMKAIGNAKFKRGFSINLSRVETDLTSIDSTRLQESLGEDRFKYARTKEEIIREQSHVREGKKFFPLLLTICSLIVVMEFLMSNRFYRGA